MKRLAGIVGADEACFGSARVQGRPGPHMRGRGAHKRLVFNIYEREGNVQTKVIPDCPSFLLRR